MDVQITAARATAEQSKCDFTALVPGVGVDSIQPAGKPTGFVPTRGSASNPCSQNSFC